MNIKHNCNNAPDKNGYEQKKGSNKITYGDLCATWYLWEKPKPNKYTPSPFQGRINQSEFIKIFGTPNPKKNNRYSWSENVLNMGKNGMNVVNGYYSTIVKTCILNIHTVMIKEIRKKIIRHF